MNSKHVKKSIAWDTIFSLGKFDDESRWHQILELVYWNSYLLVPLHV